MIAHFRGRQITESGIVLWNWSRFARNIQDAQYYRADLRRRGITIYSLNDTIPDGPEGLIFEAIIDWKNQRYLEDLSADIQRGMHHNIIQYKCQTGNPPPGYRRKTITIGTHRNGTPRQASQWVPDPITAPQAQKAFQLRAAGASLMQIIQATGLYKDTRGLSKMLRNTIYIGQRTLDGQVYQVTDPLIDSETWTAVQKINQKYSRINAENHPRRARSPFLLSGIVRCATCGYLINGKNSQQKKKGQVYKYRYYFCTYCARHSPPPINIAQKKLEQMILETLTTQIYTPENIQAITQLQQDQIAEVTAHYQTQLVQHQKAGAALDKQIDNLTQAIAQAGHSPALLARLAKLESQKRDHLATVLKTPAPPDQSPPSMRRIHEQLDQLHTQLQSAPDIQTRRAILQGLIPKIVLERLPDSQTIQGYIYFYVPMGDGWVEERPYRHKITIHKKAPK